MKGRRVVAVTDGSLLTSGVTSVLRERPDIDLVAVDGARDNVYRRVRDARPHVVIVGVEAVEDHAGLSIERMLKDNPRCTVVALSLSTPEMQVFRARQVRGATVDDLLRVLQGAREVVRRGTASPATAVGSRREAPGPRRRGGR